MKSHYARVYFSIWDDPRFSTIIENDGHLATWLRLLLRAEAAWPECVAIPRAISQPSLDALVEAGLVELHPFDTYRIHGLDAERERRSLQGKKAIAARWNTASITDSNTDVLLDTRSRTSSSSSSLGEDVRDEVSASGWAYLYPVVVELTGKHVAHGKFANDLCELAEQAGPEVVVTAMRAVAAKMAPVKPDIRALAWGVNDAIRRPPSGREVASVVQDEQERAYTARKAAERAQARLDRQRRAMALVEEDADASS